MELACALGTGPHEIAQWPWRRVQRCWILLRRKQRREERQRIFLAHQSGLGAFGSMFGGAPAGAGHEEKLEKARSLGIPVKTVTVGE